MSFFAKVGKFLRSLFLARAGRAVDEIERLKGMIQMIEATEDTEIACGEAYRLLDQFADMLLRGEDAAALMPQVQHHLEICMDCREELEALLDALRATRATGAA